MRPFQLLGLLGTCLGILAFAGSADAASIGLVPDGGCLTYKSAEGVVYFCDSDIRPTGTGYIDPFLRVQRDGNQHDDTPSTYSSGWNTDAKVVPDTNNDMDHAWTSALLAGDIGYAIPPPLAPGGPAYALFTVDVNQQGSQNRLGDILSLNHFELFNCPTNNYTSLSECGTSFFDLFGNGDWVNFDYRNHTGSGSGDIDVYIPATVGFGDKYVALLDGWGCGIPGLTCNTNPPGNKDAEKGLFPDNDGFQEWLTVRTRSTGVPEPATLLLVGVGLGVSSYTSRRRRASKRASND